MTEAEINIVDCKVGDRIAMAGDGTETRLLGSIVALEKGGISIESMEATLADIDLPALLNPSVIRVDGKVYMAYAYDRKFAMPNRCRILVKPIEDVIMGIMDRTWHTIAEDVFAAHRESGSRRSMTVAEKAEALLDGGYIESYGGNARAAAYLRSLPYAEREKIAREYMKHA